MGIGREVADAYISVHGDLSPFRKELNKAGDDAQAAAMSNAKKFTDAWGKQAERDINSKWGNIVSAAYSGEKLDLNRLIGDFDSTSLDSANEKINAFMLSMRRRGKMTADEYKNVKGAINEQIAALKLQENAEAQLSVDQKKWHEAHLQMMEGLAAARKRDADLVKFYADAEAKKQSDATRRALDAARALREEQERYAASFKGMTKALEIRELERDFRNLTEAVRSGDFSTITRGHKDMASLRDRTREVTDEMHKLGLVTYKDMSEIDDALARVSARQADYNVQWNGTNNHSARHKRDWTVIQNMIGNAAKKFAGFSGLNVLTDLFREGADFFQNLDRNAVKIGKITVLMGSAAASILHAVGGLAVMGQDLAAIGNIGILAPGFLTAVGIGVGVMVAALKDMGTVLGDLKPRFAALQDSISAKFWAQAEKPIRNLVDGLFPTLQTQLANTATGMGALTGAFAAAFAGAATPDRVTGMFEKMNAAIDILKGAMEPLVAAFVTMGEIGSQYFERFATWIVELSTRFNNFIQAAAADGRLNAWIETALTNLQAVGSILGSLVGIWNAIGDAASGAGIGGLASFATALENASAVMNSPAFQSTLMMLFVGAANAARDVGQAIIDLGPSIESIMPTISLALVSIGDTMSTVIGYIGELMQNPVLQQGITDFVSGISAGVAALAPAIGPMGDSLGQIGTLLGQVAGTVGMLVAVMATSLSPVLDTVTAAFGRITFAAGPEIASIIETIGSIMGTLVATLLPPLENLIMAVLPLLAPAFAALEPIFGALAGVFAPIINGVTQLVNMIAPYLVPAFQQISAAVTPVLEVLGQVVGFILSVLVPILGFLLIGVINNVVGVFQGLSNFIMGFVAIVTAIFTGFGDFFTLLFAGKFPEALNALGTMFSSIWDGIVQMLSGALEAIWNFVQLLFIGKLIGGIKTGLSAIVNFFKSSWDNVGGTVSGALNAVLGFVTNGLNAARNFVSNALSGMVNFFSSGFSNMVSATSSGIGNVMGFIGGIPGKISGALSGLGNLLVNAGKAIIDGLLQGLKNAWGAVTSFVGGIADWIANNKGPLPYDRRLLIPAGQAIMDGLGNGLESKLGMLKGVLDTVTSTMTDSVTDAFAHSKMYLAGADAALGLADGLKANKGAVANALNAVIPTSSSTVGLNLAAPGRSTSVGVGGSTPTTIVNINEGAIPVTTPTKDPELVASKVIDGFAGFSNF